MGWRGLPDDLNREMENVRHNGEEVKELSIGFDGDWFLRTNSRHACKTEHMQAGSMSNVDQFAQLVQRAGHSLADYEIQFFTFVPDPAGYVTVLHKTDGSLTRCAWHNVPRKLDEVLEQEGPKGVRHVTVGVNGAYVVILNSGAVLWGAGVPERLDQLLGDAERRRRSVATVSLSLVSSSWYFVQFADRVTEFDLPPDWHQTVNHYSAQTQLTSTPPRMATSYNHGAPHGPHRSQTYPQHGSQLPQYGANNPAGPVPSYGGQPNPGHRPSGFQSNSYFSFSTFTGTPQQPVNTFPNVYNPVPQQPQQRHQPQQQSTTSSLARYTGMFTLLGGALKLAVAVLAPAFQNDWRNFTDN